MRWTDDSRKCFVPECGSAGRRPPSKICRGISDYLEAHHPRYRQPTMRKLYEKINALKETPNIGRPGRVEGTREILFSPMPYVAVYRVHNQAIEVWRIWHTSQSRSN